MAAPFKFTHAVVSRIPSSLKIHANGIDLDEAKKQHEAYVRLLRELGLDVIELPPDENLPEGVFVEDAAVVCNGIALVTKPGAKHRLQEAATIKAVLKKELNLPIIEIPDSNVKLDGGDVLFTGKEFFVGISEWTNEYGAQAVASAFPEYPCTPIKITEPRKHLKSYLSIAGPDVLCVSSSKACQEVLKRIEREATFTYQTLTVPDDEATNVLYLNGTLIHRSVDEVPKSYAVFAEKVDYSRKSVKFSQLGNACSGLSSCCLLIKRSKFIKNL